MCRKARSAPTSINYCAVHKPELDFALSGVAKLGYLPVPWITHHDGKDGQRQEAAQGGKHEELRVAYGLGQPTAEQRREHDCRGDQTAMQPNIGNPLCRFSELDDHV